MLITEIIKLEQEGKHYLTLQVVNNVNKAAGPGKTTFGNQKNFDLCCTKFLFHVMYFSCQG